MADNNNAAISGASISSAVIPQEPTLVLMTRSGHKLGLVPGSNVVAKFNLNAADELSFQLNKSIGVEDASTKIWDSVESFKLLWCKEWNKVYEIYVELDEGDGLVKYVTAKSLGEAELSQINIHNIEINTETDISRDDYDPDNPTIFYDPEHPERSLLHRISEKISHYEFGYIAPTLRNIQRTFTFDGVTIYDAHNTIAEEIGCFFTYDCYIDENWNIARIINAYDLESCCNDCATAVKSDGTPDKTRRIKARGDFEGTCPTCGGSNITPGYGDDTTIFVSTENLTDEVRLSSDTDSLKNYFRFEAGDDDMTAAVINTNPDGTQYLWMITDAMKEDMSNDLVTKLNSYDAYYQHFLNTHTLTLPEAMPAYNNIVNSYNSIMGTNYPVFPNNYTLTGYPEIMEWYYNIIDFYYYIKDAMMPTPSLSDTTAAIQAGKLTSSSLSGVAVEKLSSLSKQTADSAMLGMAKVIVDSRYKVEIENSSLNTSTKVWSGTFKVTNYSDDEDTALSSSVSVTITDDYTDYVNQKIKKELKKKVTNDATDIVTLFDMNLTDFRAEIKKYGLVPLSNIHDCASACIGVLVEEGTWDDKTSDLYIEIYDPYIKKLRACEDEVYDRERDVDFVYGKFNQDNECIDEGIRQKFERRIGKIHDNLDVETYIRLNDPSAPLYRSSNTYSVNDVVTYNGYKYRCTTAINTPEPWTPSHWTNIGASTYKEDVGDALWAEFCSYRREDEYSNSNYISDGLSNSEIIEKAQEFFEVAKKELYKAATLQHSITSTLANLLVISEFQPIVNKFALGNWIRVKINDIIYRLRMIGYEVDFDNLENLSVEFSNVSKTADGLSDVKSVLDQASSMATSYGSVTRQAKNGSDSNTTIIDWYNRGLPMSQVKMFDTAEDQNITWDMNGLLARKFDDIEGGYSDKQLKIVNNGLYLTDDNWETARAGIGEFSYWNPFTQTTEITYGVAADTIIGNIILGSKVGIYNQSNSMSFTTDGLSVESATNRITINPNSNSQILNVKKISGATETDILSFDSSGNLTINGFMTAGLIRDRNNTNYWNLDTGEMKVGANILIEGSGGTQSFSSIIGAMNGDISDALDGVQDAIDYATAAQSAVAIKITTFYTDEQNPPTATATGDLWIDTSNGNIMKRWDGNEWTVVQDDAIQDAYLLAGEARSIADGKIVTFAQPRDAQQNPPTATDIGDLWIDTGDDNKLYRWNGSAWVPLRDGTIAEAQDRADDAWDYADAAYTLANGRNRAFYTSTEPDAQTYGPFIEGDMWFNPSNGYKMSRWTGSAWSEALFSSAAFSEITAGKISAGTIQSAVEATNLTMSGGSIDMTTNTESYDVIKLKYTGVDEYNEGGEYYTEIRPGKYRITKTNTSETVKVSGFIDSHGFQFTHANVNPYVATDFIVDDVSTLLYNKLVFGLDSGNQQSKTTKYGIDINTVGTSGLQSQLRRTSLNFYNSTSGGNSGDNVTETQRANLTVDSSSSKLILRDTNGTSRVEAIYDTGSGGNRFAIRDSDGVAHMVLSAGDLDFRNGNNTTTAKYPNSLTASRVLVTDSSNSVTTSSVTASQLSDMATRYIVDTGTTDSWHWNKYTNGSIEMWKRINLSSVAMTTQAGNFYRSAAQTATYPSGFFSTLAVPQITCAAASATFASLVYSQDTSNNTTKAVFYLARGSSGTDDVRVFIHVWGY